MIFDRGDVVVVPFPYTDRAAAYRRPALVVSGAKQNEATGNVGFAMITAAAHSSWPLDVPLTGLLEAGLSRPCVVRMKLLTLETGLVIGKRGRLSAIDAAAADVALADYVGASTRGA